jgi:selenium-binding protein 1
MGSHGMASSSSDTFHASAKLAMQAPPEKLAYTVMLSPDFSRPDALAVVDLDPGSKSFGKIVHTVIMPNKGDEFHHFGWNACSSALSPLAGHAFLEPPRAETHRLAPLSAQRHRHR